MLLIGNLLSFAGLAVGQQENERLLLELVQLGIDEDRLRELFEPHLDDIDFALLREIQMESRLSDKRWSCWPICPVWLAATRGQWGRVGVRAEMPSLRRTRTWKSIACQPSGTRSGCNGKRKGLPNRIF